MGKFTIEDDCFAPRRIRWIDYSGPDPLAWTREASIILRSLWECSTTALGEPRWMWDWTGDPIQMYYNRIAVHQRTTGRFSKIILGIKMVGFKSKAKNDGTFKMELESVVRHEFSGNKFVMFMWWIYWHVFFNTIRQSMVERCKAMTERFIAVIKEIYNMGSIEVD
jgi:hypothetical protein